MILAGLCVGTDAVPPPASLMFARDALGIRVIRLTAFLQDIFPAPDRQEFDALDRLIRYAREARIRIYLSPCNVPASVTGGEAVYVANVGGSSCQVLSMRGVPRVKWATVYDAATGLAEDRAATVAAITAIISPLARFDAAWVAEKFIENYEGELRGGWAWNDPQNPAAGVHLWGTRGFEDADKLSAPRPHLKNPPGIDPEFMAMVGRTFAERYGDVVDYWGMPLNEPDIDMFYPDIRIDGVNVPGGPDVVRERMWPQFVTPCVTAVRQVLASSLIRPRFVGVEVATAGMLQRCIDADPKRETADILSGHWYAWDGWPDDSYHRVKDEYLPILRADGRPFICGEVDGPSVPQDLATDTTSIVAWRRRIGEMNTGAGAIFYLTGERFIDGWKEGTPELNRTGVEMAKVNAEENVRHRAVAHAA